MPMGLALRYDGEFSSIVTEAPDVADSAAAATAGFAPIIRSRMRVFTSTGVGDYTDSSDVSAKHGGPWPPVTQSLDYYFPRRGQHSPKQQFVTTEQRSKVRLTTTQSRCSHSIIDRSLRHGRRAILAGFDVRGRWRSRRVREKLPALTLRVRATKLYFCQTKKRSSCGFIMVGRKLAIRSCSEWHAAV